MDEFYIILTGALVAISCGLTGCYLILRRMAMIGDAISHAVLPGIVIAFLLTGTIQSLPMLIGAGLVGVLSTMLIEFIHRKAKVQTDAAIGITFTFLFAVGIILISAFASNVDIDQDCILFGEIAFIPLDTTEIFPGFEVPLAVLTLSFTLLVNIAFITLGYKQLFITTFDPAYASAIGISASVWHYLLMGAVSFTTVASFEAVGAILVVAFLVAPPATAYLLTESFKTMLALTVLFGIIASAAGYALATAINGSIAGAMTTVAGALFLAAFIFTLIKKRNRTQITEVIDKPDLTESLKAEA
ncbi:metal ABC transporter permease [Cytophagaceae bacterium ABcell3]|nr:metal ABC transporter permease [Cytophagaceae bacterium ABcell3]